MMYGMLLLTLGWFGLLLATLVALDRSLHPGWMRRLNAPTTTDVHGADVRPSVPPSMLTSHEPRA